MVDTYAVVPTYARPAELGKLLNQLMAEGVRTVVVCNGGYDDDDPAFGYPPGMVEVRHEHDRPPHLYRMWNVGLRAVDRWRGDAAAWNVAVLNDDAVLPAGWASAVAAALRQCDVVAACTARWPEHNTGWPQVIRGIRDNIAWMCPWAFMLRGEAGLFADEEFRWWWGDTDLDFRARQSGGLVIVPDLLTDNTYATETTVGELAAQAERDQATFLRKWAGR